MPITGLRRWLLLLGPALLSLLGLIALLVYESRAVPAWQLELNRYQTEQMASDSEFTAGLAVAASWPERYGANMPFRPASESVDYRAEIPAAEIVGTDGRRPLLYPPTEVICVQVQEEGGAERVLLVVHHQDAFNADWLIYEPIGSAVGIDAALLELGCSFEQ